MNTTFRLCRNDITRFDTQVFLSDRGAMSRGPSTSSRYRLIETELSKIGRKIEDSGNTIHKIFGASVDKFTSLNRRIAITVEVYPQQNKQIDDYRRAFLKMKNDFDAFVRESREEMRGALALHRANVKALRDVYRENGLRLNDLAPSVRAQLHLAPLQLSDALDENSKRMQHYVDGVLDAFRESSDSGQSPGAAMQAHREIASPRTKLPQSPKIEDIQKLETSIARDNNAIEAKRKQLQRQLKKLKDNDPQAAKLEKLLMLTNCELALKLRI